MIRSISCTPKFNKRLDALQKAGKKAALSARKADKIIASLSRCGSTSPDLAAGITRNGEKRSRNCIKYDLGNG